MKFVELGRRTKLARRSMTGVDVHRRSDLAFPKSLPKFQRLFPDDAACAGYLERARWADGFVCPYCGVVAEPFRIATRPGILECRTCRRQTSLLVGTVMERSHTPLNIWFWAAYPVWCTVHLVGVCVNRIDKLQTTSRKAQ